MATIYELRFKFDSLPAAQKNQFMLNLKKLVEGSGSAEHKDFYNECVQKYNAEVQSKTKQPAVTAANNAPPQGSPAPPQPQYSAPQSAPAQPQYPAPQSYPAPPQPQYTAPQYNPAPQQYPAYAAAEPHTVIKTLSGREKLVGIFWIVVAGLQGLLALIYLIAGVYFDAGFLGVICALNLFSGIGDLKFSKQILINPTGFQERYEKPAGFITPLAWNSIVLVFAIAEADVFWILVVMAALGVSIFAFVGVRGYAKANMQTLAALEPNRDAGEISE